MTASHPRLSSAALSLLVGGVFVAYDGTIHNTLLLFVHGVETIEHVHGHFPLGFLPPRNVSRRTGVGANNDLG